MVEDFDLSVREKIKQRMDILQMWMEDNYHLKRPEVVEEHIQTVSKFWSALDDEDRDYIEGARYTIEEQMAWDIPEEDKLKNKRTLN